MIDSRTAKQYADVARRYWVRYRPSEVAMMNDPTSFFARLGERVFRAVELGTVPETWYAEQRLPANPTAEQLVAMQVGARKVAEKIALGELVFGTPEPGMESLWLICSRPLPGWEDETE